MEKIGFIGVGIMGKPMALNLLKAGYSMKVFDIDSGKLAEVVKAGAEAGKSCKDVAGSSEIIITMLQDSPDVEKAVLGEKGVLEGIKGGSVYIDMSSIAPLVSKKLAQKIGEKNASMRDAPVSGGEPKAIDGTLAIMVGGPKDVFERVKDILAIMGGSVTLVGKIGSGNTTKLANQIIVALNIAAVSEAMVLATKAGVDPEKVFQAIRGGLAGSTVLDAKMPLITSGNFKPEFRIELHIKDMKNALETAHELGVPVPLSSQIMEIMQALKVDGKHKDDHGGIVQFYEKMSKTEVRK